MYLTKSERKDLLSAYGYPNLTEETHYQVEPDTWLYLFHDEANKKYLLVVADYLDLDIDHFPHLLKYDNPEFYTAEFILKRQLTPPPSTDLAKLQGTALFEYTD